MNGDFQASDMIILDNGFVSPDVVDFTAEIVASNPAVQNFINTVSVLNVPLPAGNNFIALTTTFYDDYSNTSDKQYSTTYNSVLDAGTNQHTETLPAASDQQAVQTFVTSPGR